MARRYVGWLARRSLAVIWAHVVLVVGAVYLILNHLPLYADFSYLLPQDAESVKDLRKLERRVKAGDTVLVLVKAPTAQARASATAEMVAGVRKIRPELVEQVDADDSELRDFLRPRKHLFVPLADLQRAHEALERRIKDAKLKANPLYIELDDEPSPAATSADREQLEQLQQRRKEAEARLDRPGNISADGLVSSIQVRTPFRSTDAGKGQQLIDAMSTVRAAVSRAHPGVEIGFAGGVITAVAEHNAISSGMVLSSVITALLVGLVLALYFRSATLLTLLLGMLIVSTALSFGLAAITVGHLNAATAFLGAIIAGNGVNYGILLIARYLEERRKGKVTVEDALGLAVLHTLKPTAIASLGAAIAYGSLAATSFKGFADFALIGALGMIVCWIATYVLLPALILRWGRNSRNQDGDPFIGRTLVAVLGFRRSGVVCAVALVLSILATVIVVRYIAADPFEYDIKHLRSIGADAVTARNWMRVSDQAFGRGITGRTYIAADRPDQVPQIVAALKARNASAQPDKQTIGSISSILDVVPEDQPQKIELLAKIRGLLTDEALEALDDKERAEVIALRPPADLAPITIDQLPRSLTDRLAERDGKIGLLISIRPADQLNEWDGRDLIRFANAVRRLELADGETVTTSGSSVIFADIVESIERDGPLVTAIAAGGLLIMVVLLVGPNRRAAAVLLGTASGTLLMVATCALLGLRVNFLDFVALPITLGLGIDYAINVAHRQANDDDPDPIQTLRTSGAAVFVCSLTTIIGYGSLLASSNLAIRGFGMASLIGEIACVFTALVLVPAMLARGRKRVVVA